MLQARSTPRKDYVWIDCFFYGFYVKKDRLLSFQCHDPTLVEPPMHQCNMSNVPFSNMKRVNTTRQRLDCKVTTKKQSIPVHKFLAMIDL